MAYGLPTNITPTCNLSFLRVRHLTTFQLKYSVLRMACRNGKAPVPGRTGCLCFHTFQLPKHAELEGVTNRSPKSTYEFNDLTKGKKGRAMAMGW